MSKIRLKLIAFWFSGVAFGAFAVVGDEIQPLQWDAYYNFPLIGALPKFGGYWYIGAWDLVFILILFASVCSMILYGDLSSKNESSLQNKV